MADAEKSEDIEAPAEEAVTEISAAADTSAKNEEVPTPIDVGKPLATSSAVEVETEAAAPPADAPKRDDSVITKNIGKQTAVSFSAHDEIMGTKSQQEMDTSKDKSTVKPIYPSRRATKCNGLQDMDDKRGVYFLPRKTY